MNRVMGLALCAILLIMCVTSLSGCTENETPVKTVTVKVPTIVKPVPPKELIRVAITDAQLPVFIDPSDPHAVVGLDAANEAKLKALALDREKRLDGWEAWAAKK